MLRTIVLVLGLLVTPVRAEIVPDLTLQATSVSWAPIRFDYDGVTASLTFPVMNPEGDGEPDVITLTCRSDYSTVEIIAMDWYDGPEVFQNPGYVSNGVYVLEAVGTGGRNSIALSFFGPFSSMPLSLYDGEDVLIHLYEDAAKTKPLYVKLTNNSLLRKAPEVAKMVSTCRAMGQ